MMPIVVAFEGLDGCGKSTQVQALKSVFEENNLPVKVFSQIPKGPIRDLLLTRDGMHPWLRAMLYFEAAKDTAIAVKAAVQEGYNVIMDRCIWSIFCYNMEEGAMQAIDLMLEEHRDIVVYPDLVVHLKMEAEQIAHRLREKRKDVVESRPDWFFKNVAVRYQECADQLFYTTKVATVPASLEKREITSRVIDEIESMHKGDKFIFTRIP